MQIASNLKALREQKGFTQEEFAKAVGISREVIAKYETGWRVPKFEQALKIAEVLGITCEELAYGKAEQKES